MASCQFDSLPIHPRYTQISKVGIWDILGGKGSLAVKMTTNEPLFPYKARFRAFLRTNLKNRVRRKKCCTKCTPYADDKIMRKTVELQSFTVQRTGVQTVRHDFAKIRFFTDRGGQGLRCPEIRAPCGHRADRCCWSAQGSDGRHFLLPQQVDKRPLLERYFLFWEEPL